MAFLAVMDVRGGRAAKVAEFASEQEAIAHLDTFKEKWPDAFTVEKPSSDFREWFFDGKTVSIVKPTPRKIERVTARQFKMQLHNAGLLATVEAWVAMQSELVQIAYANSNTFLRSEPMMQAGFAALNFTSEQIDEFFAAAAEL